MRLRFLSIALVLGFLAACSDGSSRQGEVLVDLSPEVSISAGPILGQDSERAGAWEWLGIPYAAAPVGDLRWRAPQPAASWAEPLATQAFAPECPHFEFFGSYVGREDCLFLNVWRPRSQERELPVMVWIHGGGNNTGSANWPVYNGARLAEQANIVVVTIQYRLGPLGWLYHPALRDGSSDDNTGNFGTLDIIAALQWVQENIRQFGGDAEAVSVAGESAGGANILSLMLSERSRNLFQQAIVQSAGGSVTSIPDAARSGRRFVAAMAEAYRDGQLPEAGEPTAQFLRSLSAEQIKQADPGGARIFGDGSVIPAAGFALFESGDFPMKVPLLIGTNKDEYKLYTNPLGYNVMPDASPELKAAAGRYVSDMWRVEGADAIATRLRNLPDFPDIYVYRFNWGSPDADGNSPLPPPFGPTGGAHHGAEMPFMFGNWDTFLVDAYRDLLFTEANAASRRTMSRVMVDYWGSFIRQGNPNGGNLPAWSPWSNTEGEFRAIVLDVNYADNEPAIGEDYEAWTADYVLEQARANVPEPTLSELLEILEGRSVVN